MSTWRIDLGPTALSADTSITFDYQVILCADFADLLASRGRRMSRLSLATVAKDRGRVLLQARGGSGKSTLLHTIASDITRRRDGDSKRTAVAYVAAQTWRNALSNDLPDDAVATETLLECIESVAKSSFSHRDPLLILIDGLNEIPDSLGNLLLEAVASMTWRTPNASTIVADRVTHRPVSAVDWAFATLSSVSAESIAKVLGLSQPSTDSPLLDRPFYLELARQAEIRGQTAGGIQRAALRKAGLSESSIRRLADAIFAQYARHKSRQFEFSQLAAQVEPATLAALLRSRLVIRTDDVASMAHHLLGDYLASQAIGDESRNWNRHNLDSLTFDGSSFDALTILVETLSSAKRDEFLRRVHDWNFNASVHLLVECKNSNLALAPAVEFVLLYMLAEKRRERIKASSTHASAILAAYPGELSGRLYGAATWDELTEIVEQQEFEADWFPVWKGIAARVAGTSATAADVGYLAHTEGVIGWSATNLLRRLNVSVKRHAEIVALTAHPDPIVRWRGVHVLGRHCKREALAALLRCLRSDEYLWVRYGALRSLIEAAAEVPPTRRRQIFESLAESAESIREYPMLLREVERDLDVADAPPDWSESAGQLIVRLLEISATVSEQDRWRRVGARLRLGAAALE